MNRALAELLAKQFYERELLEIEKTYNKKRQCSVMISRENLNKVEDFLESLYDVIDMEEKDIKKDVNKSKITEDNLKIHDAMLETTLCIIKLFGLSAETKPCYAERWDGKQVLLGKSVTLSQESKKAKVTKVKRTKTQT